MVTPTEVAVRMYQVGFGDCFLLSFTYGPGDVRHLLIDFGQKSGVKRRDGGPAMGDKALIAVAEDIRGRVGDGLLAGIVVSHRHEDHLSAFGIPKVEEIISSLHPQVVLRPWTERPEAARDEGKPTRTEGRYLAGLAAATGMAEQLTVHRFAAERSVAGQALIGAARSELPNGPAIRALERIGDAATAEYLAARRPGEPEVRTAIADHLPGVTIDILGPPRPDAWPPIRGQREDDPEYWGKLTRKLNDALAMEPGTREQGATRELGEVAGDDDEQPVDAGVAELVEIGPARFVVDKLRRQQVHSVLRIVRWLDRSLNNTSLILLLTIGERRLLFGGDAQIENWSYAIGDGGHPDRARYLEALRKVDLYKVGHHGSRNATPKTLYRGWRKASGHGTAPLSLMSTLSKVYGESDGTFVPSSLLTSALGRSPFRLVSTEAYARDLLYVDVAAGVDLGDTFQVKPGAG